MLQRVSPDVVRLLLEAGSEALAIADKKGMLPLHCALRAGVPCEVVGLLLASAGGQAAARVSDAYNSLPLHWATYHMKGHALCVDTIRIVLAAYPQAVREHDGEGNLPLHAVLQSDASRRQVNAVPLEAVRLLIDAFPPAAAAQNKLSRLPLCSAITLSAGGAGHHADSWPLPVFEAVLAAYPQAAEQRIPNEGNVMPLHYALKCRASRGIVQSLLKHYEEAVRTVDNDGKTPLHDAVQQRAPLDVVRMVLQADEAAARVQQEDGLLPLPRMLNTRGGGLGIESF